MRELLFGYPALIIPIFWIVIVVLGVIGAVWALKQGGKQKEPQCRGCRYNNMGDCDCTILCENGELWEPVKYERR